MPETTAALVDYSTVSMPASITLDLLDSVCAALQRRIDATEKTFPETYDSQPLARPDVVTGQLIELHAWIKNVANVRESYRKTVDGALARRAAAENAS